MKYRDENNVWQELYLPPTGDTLPIGTEVDYDGEDVPYGWEEVEEPKDVYSTDEVKTNKVWVDGKPIYRKIVVYDKGTRTGKIETNHGISDVDKIVSIGGFVTNNTEFIPLPSAITIDNVNPYSISLQTSTRTKFTIFVGTVFTTSWTFYIITEYTKTTDQGSGS